MAGFIVDVVQYLSPDRRCGVILYRRDEGVSVPSLSVRSALDLPAVEFRFNFHMPNSTLCAAFARAVRLAAGLTGAGLKERNLPREVVYHQTNTLLDIHPHSLPFLVTHHSPFAAEICRIFGQPFAVEAFQGGPTKLSHLIAKQARGLASLRRASCGAALDLSTVQERVLLKSGVPRIKIFRASPPSVSTIYKENKEVPQFDRDSIGNKDPARPRHRNLHVICATSRIDSFKNIVRLVDAADRLISAGTPINLSLFVGTVEEQATRQVLFNFMSERLRANSIISARLPHSRLLELFAQNQSHGVFVCSSVYETLGITPLEAILSGLTTLVPDEPDRIGVTEYVTQEHRYTPTVDGLTEALQSLSRANDLGPIGQRQCNFARLASAQRTYFVVFERTLDYVCRARHSPRARSRSRFSPEPENEDTCGAPS